MGDIVKERDLVEKHLSLSGRVRAFVVGQFAKWRDDNHGPSGQPDVTNWKPYVPSATPSREVNARSGFVVKEIPPPKRDD